MPSRLEVLGRRCLTKQRITISLDKEIINWVDKQVNDRKYASRSLAVEKCLMGCAKHSSDSQHPSPPSGSSGISVGIPCGKPKTALKQSIKKPAKPPSQSPPSSTARVAILEGMVESQSGQPPKRPTEPSSTSGASSIVTASLNGRRDSSSQPSPKKFPEPPWQAQKKKVKEKQKVHIYEYET